MYHLTPQQLGAGAERAFDEWARSRGWQMWGYGWPDRWGYQDGKLILVEIKASRHAPFNGTQATLLQALANCHVRCHRWSPDIGARRIRPARIDPL
jgi:hypothetical protein